MMNRAYIDAVRLLLEVAPEVFHDPVFALKGGTAINLFLHDMPRLSVDLDLVYTDHSADRDEALQHIGAALAAASATLESRGIHCERGSSAEETKLFVERARVRVKIEINHVFRGTVLPVVSRPLSENGQSTFFTDIELPVLDPDEIYGSKLVAVVTAARARPLRCAGSLRTEWTHAQDCGMLCLLPRRAQPPDPRSALRQPHRHYPSLLQRICRNDQGISGP